jgi:hypothetical protein
VLSFEKAIVTNEAEQNLKKKLNKHIEYLAILLQQEALVRFLRVN